MLPKPSNPAPEYSTIARHGRNDRLSTQDLDTLIAATSVTQAVAPYISPIMDLKTLNLVRKDLGITGRAYPKVIKGRQYIAFTGNRGLREMFPGTIYSANNKKIVEMAIGSLGIKNMVKEGGIITFVLIAPLTVLELYLKDQFTLSAIAGSLSSNILQIGISSLMGAIVGLITEAFTTIACAPIAMAIGAGFIVGEGLSWADKRYNLTEKLITELEKMGDEMNKIAGQAESTLYRGTKDFFKSQGLRIPDY